MKALPSDCRNCTQQPLPDQDPFEMRREVLGGLKCVVDCGKAVLSIPSFAFDPFRDAVVWRTVSDGLEIGFDVATRQTVERRQADNLG